MNKKNKLLKSLNPKSLSFQLLFRSLLFMTILLLLIGFFQYILMREFIYRNQASNIQNQILSVRPDLWEQLLINAKVGIPNHLPLLSLSGSIISYIDKDGNIFVLSSPQNNLETKPPVLNQEDYLDAMKLRRGIQYKIINQDSGGEQLVVLQSIMVKGLSNGIIQVSISTKTLKDMLIQQVIIFFLLAILALFGGILAFRPVLKRTLIPLSKLVKKVEDIDVENLNNPFPVEQGQIEIDRLAISFNKMLKRLESSFKAEKEAKEQMRRFIADASHELRTPLTSIHGFLEVLLRGAINQPDQLVQSVKSMHVESERMKKLVQDLLLLAKLDQSPIIELNEGQMDIVIKEMEAQLRLLSGNRKVIFKLDSHVKSYFDENKIKQVILNLFQNAVQHTDSDNGIIELTLLNVKNGINLIVKDNGSGISEEHIPYLFDRFYRIDTSRTRESGGSGLGLSITKSIIDLHKGKIWVETLIGIGTSFYVWLPSAKN